MKKILIIYGIVLILIGSFLVTPVVGTSLNEDDKKLELNRKILLVIGGDIHIRWIGRELYGQGFIVYAEGSILINSNFSIDFKGIPRIHDFFFVSYCFYKPR